ncbi:similar to Saccharomyces cerevisiae YGL107C RMD9 Mitochondrial protein required for respiratory growth [Maudiozyma saulgeensis]|uniref:Similar to Saccharomyces cerevisiae YGL107C RMD9 Mitochondrial protein required for respiratory growth n=1 Tax=Maudiozyma saulgeensis TaxID=1789683 RepID=A0A1X7RAS8_9SACH|nr:similar to Saccharomyces cerevisiae YGL107C RMD9 Mitochondrial protein required for respiratory growth [Kazachstania saulgeensis]
MFRFAQQSQPLKGKLPNQFIPNTGKHSYNPHMVRFNSPMSMEAQQNVVPPPQQQYSMNMNHNDSEEMQFQMNQMTNMNMGRIQMSNQQQQQHQHREPMHYNNNNNNNRNGNSQASNRNSYGGPQKNGGRNNRPYTNGSNNNSSSSIQSNSSYNSMNNGKQRQYNKGNNNNKGNNKNNTISPDSPWYQKVTAFEECVSQTLYMSQTPRRKNIKHRSEHPNSNANPMFWDSIGRAMGLYHDLIDTPELNSDRVSKLVHLLHNGLRANRNQLTRMNKKPDYDSQSFHKEMTNYLCKSLREISEDVLNSKVELNEYGAMHLITAFKELLLFEEAVEIWKSAINGINSYTSNIFLNPRVVGVILPILYDNGVSYPEIQQLYEKSSSMINYFHPNLSVGMIRASLSANENEMALKLFQKLCQESTEMKYGYLIETHLSFIGECKDLNVAQTFFDKALNDEMPYKIDLQVSYVKSFLRNIWTQTHDFNHIYQIWYKSSLHYGRHVNHGISSSLNDTFFDIFFENFAHNKQQGFMTLQNLIDTYKNIKNIDEPFFNIILAKCTIWHDREILEYIDKSYELFNIPKTIVAYRILLKSMGSVDDTSNEEILQRWIDLIKKSDEIGQKFIANADWAALRDATVTWTQSHRDNGVPLTQNSINESKASSVAPTRSGTPTPKNNMESVNVGDVDFYSHPAFQALNASGAFDEFTNYNASTPSTTVASSPGATHEEPLLKTVSHEEEGAAVDSRMILYLKIVKRYSPYCRDSRQLARLTTGTAVKYSVLQEVLNQFQSLDADSITVPKLANLKPSCA